MTPQTQSQSKDVIHQLLEDRGNVYGEAWKYTGELVRHVQPLVNDMCDQHPHLWWAWLMVLNKLVRLLFDPQHIDSWRDIAGYATLVLDEVEGKR